MMAHLLSCIAAVQANTTLVGAPHLYSLPSTIKLENEVLYKSTHSMHGDTVDGVEGQVVESQSGRPVHVGVS